MAKKQPNPEEKPPRENALERDERFGKFADLYVEKGNAYRAAIQAGYPQDYARAHAHQLVARLRLKVGKVLRSVGIDELAVAKKIKKMWNAKEPKWNRAKQKWDKFENSTMQVAALNAAIKLHSLEPATRMKVEGAGNNGAILMVHHSIPLPQRPVVHPPEESKA